MKPISELRRLSIDEIFTHFEGLDRDEFINFVTMLETCPLGEFGGERLAVCAAAHAARRLRGASYASATA